MRKGQSWKPALLESWGLLASTWEQHLLQYYLLPLTVLVCTALLLYYPLLYFLLLYYPALNSYRGLGASWRGEEDLDVPPLDRG